MTRYVEEPDHLTLTERHLLELRGFAVRLSELSGRDEEEFLLDSEAQSMAERNLHGALEAAMAAGSHVLMRLGTDLPNRYAQIFTELAAHGAIDSGLAGKMRELEEVHDILVHGTITWAAVYEQLSTGPLFINYAHQLAKFSEINL